MNLKSVANRQYVDNFQFSMILDIHKLGNKWMGPTTSSAKLVVLPKKTMVPAAKQKRPNLQGGTCRLIPLTSRK